MPIALSEHIPPFKLEATSHCTVNAQSFKQRYTVLYFYPRDNTPGCTTEGQDFNHYFDQFKALDCQIFGVSMDSLNKHEKFKEKFLFKFELISDPDAELCKIFDVYQLKKNYGKEYMGIVRSTFLINPQGVLTHQWRNIKVPDHVEEVLNTLKSIT